MSPTPNDTKQIVLFHSPCAVAVSFMAQIQHFTGKNVREDHMKLKVNGIEVIVIPTS